MTSTDTQFALFGARPGEVDTPAWVADTVFYQIFPDRFAKSDRVEKPANLEPWESEPTMRGYKGGDLLGVVEHLDYLVELGITGIYFNPIFQSASNHRYHTHDYYKVDPLLGGDAAFDELLAACKERGIRVVLDGVFNHASRGFFQFNDVLENGAASPWIDWFHFNGDFPANAYDHNRPPGYHAWVGLHALPKLNTDNPQMREYLMQVGEYWMRKGIDGWRLDVAAEIRTEGFWEEFRQRVRAINPEAWIVGEIWHIDQAYLRGDRFDALMNYVFAESALAFTGQERIVKSLAEGRGYDPWPPITGRQYAAKIDNLLAAYDWNVQLAQMNLLDSHDTTRVMSLANGDARTLELSALLMFTFPGAPTIYYGTEIGLDGGPSDHAARKAFPWEDPGAWNREVRDLFQALIRLRKQVPALRTGSYKGLAATDAAYAAQRVLDGQRVVFAVNSSASAERLALPVTGTFEPQLIVGDAPATESSPSGTVVSMPPRSGAVWIVADA